MPKSSPTKTVAFRLSYADERRLTELAAGSGKTAGELAREVTLEKLDEAETMARQVARIEQALKEHRSDFAKAVEAMMVLAIRKEPMTPEQIKTWVDTRLRHL